jgi:hypothetical protein
MGNDIVQQPGGGTSFVAVRRGRARPIGPRGPAWNGMERRMGMTDLSPATAVQLTAVRSAVPFHHKVALGPGGMDDAQN